MAGSNFFNTVNVAVPVLVTTNAPKAVLFTIGDGASDVFEVSIPGIKYVTNTYAFDTNFAVTNDYTVSSVSEQITFTFSSTIGVDSRSIIIEYVPDVSTSVVITS